MTSTTDSLSSALIKSRRDVPMCSLATQNEAKEFRGSLIGALSERSMFTSTDHCPSIAISNQYVSVSSIVLRNNDVSLAHLLLSSYCFASRHDLATHTAGSFFFFSSLPRVADMYERRMLPSLPLCAGPATFFSGIATMRGL